MEANNLVSLVIEPIKDFLEDANIQEIMVNHAGKVVVEQANKLYLTQTSLSPNEIETMIRVVASDNGINITTENPTFSSKIKEINCRFQGVLPPVSSTPIFCIRKQGVYNHNLNLLVDSGMINKKQLALLRQAILNKKNILIAGATGSGKTTLANAVLQEAIALGDRIIVVEDTPELRISESHNVRLLVGNNYTYAKAIFDVLRMRPDRIILGELRDGAALDLLKAWNTGHGGGITTIHANSAEMALARLMQLVEEVAVKPSFELVSDVIDFCIYVKRVGEKRQVTSICEVSNYSYIDKKFITKEVV